MAARTRAAAQILTSPDLLKKYEELGGLQGDLEKIKADGLRAEALNQAQSKAQAVGGAATEKVLTSFVDLQKDYSAVMAVVLAVRNDLALAKAPPEVVQAVDKILVNESEVTIREIKQHAADGAAGADPQKPKKQAKAAIRSQSQEALRAEIQKDAAALVELKPAHKALAKRKVDVARLEKLRDAAAALAGHLADRTAKKGAQKSATEAERAAVADQRQTWGACYRILASLGRVDHQVDGLLGEAARKRAAPKKKGK